MKGNLGNRGTTRLSRCAGLLRSTRPSSGHHLPSLLPPPAFPLTPPPASLPPHSQCMNEALKEVKTKTTFKVRLSRDGMPSIGARASD